MVKLQLSIKAELENVTDLAPADDNFEWFFEVKCGSCNETHPKFVSMNRLEEYDARAGTKANFAWKCGFCKRESTASFEKATFPPYAADENGHFKFAPLIVVDCRGLEFTSFDPRGVWKCKGAESGTIFDEVDLSEGEWMDYDEKAKGEVGVSKIESKWTRAP